MGTTPTSLHGPTVHAASRHAFGGVPSTTTATHQPQWGDQNRGSKTNCILCSCVDTRLSSPLLPDGPAEWCCGDSSRLTSVTSCVHLHARFLFNRTAVLANVMQDDLEECHQWLFPEPAGHHSASFYWCTMGSYEKTLTASEWLCKRSRELQQSGMSCMISILSPTCCRCLRLCFHHRGTQSPHHFSPILGI